METSQYIEISSKYPLKDIKSFIEDILKFEQQDSYYVNNDWYHFFIDNDYLYYSGVFLEILKNSNNYSIHLWTNIVNHSYYDIEYENHCIDMFKKYFKGKKRSGGYYWGPDKLIYEGLKRERSESGCYLAYELFKSNLGKVETFVYTKNFSKYPPTSDARVALDHHPEIISNNLVIPFIISSLESYFRATFLALFRYSNKKNSFFKKYTNKISDELFLVSDGEMSIDEALAKYISFQNIDSIDTNFKLLQKDIDLKAILKKEKINDISLYERLSGLIFLRHRIIHESNFYTGYTKELLLDDIKIIKYLVDTFYSAIINANNWQVEV